MNNRLTMQDLAGLLEDYTGKDRKSTELFLKELVTVVSEGVYTDKIVKIKGLGTFKIVPIEKRASMNVNTGERFIIPEHYKFSFLPDRELKELVNKPFSFFEATELNEHVDFSDLEETEDAEEKDQDDISIEEILPEPEPELEPESDVEQVEETIEEPIEEPAKVPDCKETVAETLVVETPIVETPVAEIPVVREPVLPPPHELPLLKPFEVPLEEKQQYWAPEMPESSGSSLKGIIIGFLLFALVGVGIFGALHALGYITLSNPFSLHSNYAQKVQTIPLEEEALPADIVSDTIQVDTNQVVMPLPADTTIALTAENIPAAQPESVTPPTPVVAKESKASALDTLKIKAGDRLTTISLEYYGSKTFWVYLYEYNKERIDNPNNVPIGTMIIIPAPAIYGINARDRASLQKAAALQAEILNAKP